MIRCNVAVTGLSAADDPAPGIAVARSIRDSGQWEGKIIGLAYDAMDTGIYSPGFLDEVYLLPNPFDRNGVLQRLSNITRSTRIDVLIPLLDFELLNLPSLEPSLKEMGINLLLPSVYKVGMHLKLNLAEFCRENDIKYPKQMAIASLDKIVPSFEELGIPMVIKGIIHGAHLAYSVEEAFGYFNQIRKRWGLPIIVQEFVHGEEYNVDSLVDRGGRLIGAVAMRKLSITDKGKAWSGVTIENEELLNLNRDILDKLGWVGPIELEFIKQRSSGNYYLMEINPRFGTWIYLAANAGQNLPLATIQLAMGQKIEPLPHYTAGLIFTRCSLDSVCSVKRLANLMTEGELILREGKI